MKTALTLIFFIVFFTSYTFADELKLYKDKKYGFSITYPEDWAVSYPGESVEFRPAGINGSISVHVQDLSSNPKKFGPLEVFSEQDLKVFREQIEINIAKDFNTENVASDKTFLANQEALEFKFLSKHKALDVISYIYCHQIMTIKDNRFYYITLNAGGYSEKVAKETFSQLWPLFKSSVISFMLH